MGGGSLDSNEKEASGEVVIPEGPDVNVVSGGVTSIAQVH
jgi:hypothetical protein